jgi:hypothetical protein
MEGKSESLSLTKRLLGFQRERMIEYREILCDSFHASV